MVCHKQCNDFKRLVQRLEATVVESGCCYVPESFERQAQNYCNNCIYDGEIGTGRRVVLVREISYR